MGEGKQHRGKRVRHGRYGEGTVQAVERGGLALRVLFDSFPGLAVSLPSRSLRLVGAEDAPLAPLAPRGGRGTDGRPATLLSAEDFERHQVLEALRLGVVPTKGLLAYTVARDAEVEDFLAVLEGREPRKALAVLGDYGTGKTHLLELVQHLALERGWVVGRAWLDPQEAPPSKPRRVYAAIARSLCYPDRREAGELGLWPLLERAAGVGELAEGFRDEDGQAHVFLDPALRYARALTAAMAKAPGDPALAMLQLHLLDWIEGRATGLNARLQTRLHRRLPVRSRVLALSDFSTLSKVYGYLLSGLGRLARLSGYRGLCVLLDETELFSDLGAEQRAKAVEVFRVLLAAALPGDGHEALDLSDVGDGGRGVIRRIPPRFGRATDLAIGLAATPGSESEAFLRHTLGDALVHELVSFRQRDYLEMGDRVLRLYAEAHPELPRRVLAALESRMQMWIGSGQARAPREFGRRVVDFLDQQRHARRDFG